MTVTFIQGHRHEKKNSLYQFSYFTKVSIRITFIMLLRPVGVMKLIFILSCLICIQGREPNLNEFIPQNSRLLFGHSQTSFFCCCCCCKLEILIETMQLFILMPVLVTVTFNFGLQLHKKSKTATLISLQISQSICMKLSTLPQPVGLLKLMLNLGCMITMQGRELFLPDSVKYTLTLPCF